MPYSSEDQKKESKIIKQLQERVSQLTQALNEATKEKHAILRTRDEEVMDLKDHNHSLQLALKEIKDHSPQHTELVDQVIQKKKLKKELHSKLLILEKQHKELESAKKHDPVKLKELEKKIKEIKKKLK